MNIHLLDIPKPRRSHLMPNVPWMVLAGLCVGLGSFGWYSGSKMSVCYQQSILISEPNPNQSALTSYSPELVRWVTVTTRTSRQGSYYPGVHVSFYTHQEPLMELYDELCEIEDKAETEMETDCIPLNNAQKEQIYLKAEKKFMQKYTLTEKQVAMIKRDGYRIKHSNE